jgi:hypothetical protein
MREILPGIHHWTALHPRIRQPVSSYYVESAIGDGVTAFADGLTRPGGGTLAFVPDFLMGEDPKAVKNGLVTVFRNLLGLSFDSLLFAHGDPLVGGGRRALEEFVENSV